MKTSLRILLSIVFICGLSIATSYGKGYTIPVHSITVNKVDSSQTVIQLQLINNDTLPGTRIDTIKWVFISNGLAYSGWGYNFCDFAACYTPPGLPNGATDYLTPKTNGDFTLTVTSFNSKATTATMLIKVWDPRDANNPDTISITINATRLGIANNIVPSASISIFPNPATDYINITTNQIGFEPVKATIYNILGKQVSEQYISAGTSSLPVYDLPKGVYIMSLRDQYGREAIKQFVKE